MRMNLEQMDHFLRHIEMHATELRNGQFKKGKEYMEKLKDAQHLALEVSHDIIHVMRTKQFKGYEDADFSFDVELPAEWEKHQFRKFDYQSFSIGCKLKATIDLGMVQERNILLEKKDAESQMVVLGNAIQDAEVLIKMLQKHFDEA